MSDQVTPPLHEWTDEMWTRSLSAAVAATKRQYTKYVNDDSLAANEGMLPEVLMLVWWKRKGHVRHTMGVELAAPLLHDYLNHLEALIAEEPAAILRQKRAVQEVAVVEMAAAFSKATGKLSALTTLAEFLAWATQRPGLINPGG